MRDPIKGRNEFNYERNGETPPFLHSAYPAQSQNVSQGNSLANLNIGIGKKES